MKKELKRQIKQDEFRGGLEMGLGWIWERRDELKFGAIVAVLVVVGAWGLTFYQSKRAGDADRAFSEALAMFQAPLEADVQPGAPPPTGPVFATEQEKLTKAAAAFDGVERRYGSSALGVRAGYYGALCRIGMGKLEEAEKALKTIASRAASNALEPGLARLALADVERRAGKVDQAIDSYRRLVDEPASDLPRDHALMELAATLEEAHRIQEAHASYRRLVDEFPESVYASEARRRADYLKPSAEG